jgi:hypothetical protein
MTAFLPDKPHDREINRIMPVSIRWRRVENGILPGQIEWKRV